MHESEKRGFSDKISRNFTNKLENVAFSLRVLGRKQFHQGIGFLRIKDNHQRWAGDCNMGHIFFGPAIENSLDVIYQYDQFPDFLVSLVFILSVSKLTVIKAKIKHSMR